MQKILMQNRRKSKLMAVSALFQRVKFQTRVGLRYLPIPLETQWLYIKGIKKNEFYLDYRNQ